MIAATDLRELIWNISQNDHLPAYKKLFILYQCRLTRFSQTIVGNKESAEEVVSDVFIKIWTNRKNLQNIDNIHLYLYVSTRNLSVNYLHKQVRNRSYSIDESVVDLKSLYFDPEQLMITSEMFRRVKYAIRQLPPRCQLIFKLIKEDGLSYKEVAELLELSIKTIESQMTIALKKIARSIHFDIQKSISF